MIAMMQVMEERSMNQRTKTRLKKAGKIGAGAGAAAAGLYGAGIGIKDSNSHGDIPIGPLKRGPKEISKGWDKLTGQ